MNKEYTFHSDTVQKCNAFAESWYTDWLDSFCNCHNVGIIEAMQRVKYFILRFGGEIIGSLFFTHLLLA